MINENFIWSKNVNHCTRGLKRNCFLATNHDFYLFYRTFVADRGKFQIERRLPKCAGVIDNFQIIRSISCDWNGGKFCREIQSNRSGSIGISAKLNDSAFLGIRRIKGADGEMWLKLVDDIVHDGDLPFHIFEYDWF